MALLPIAPVALPSDLAGQTNGRLDPRLLVSVPGGGQLHHLAARAWVALVVNALAHASMGLTYTPGGTYRSYGQQETLFRSRYKIGGTGGGCKRWLNALWCKIKAALATAATPGSSNHGLGLAIDSAYDDDLTDGISPDDAAYILGHPGWNWLLANAHRFGFSWELQSEPWHIRYVAGDNVPADVLAWEAFIAGTPPDQPVPPPPGPTIEVGEMRLCDERELIDTRTTGDRPKKLFAVQTHLAGIARAVEVTVTAVPQGAPGFVTTNLDAIPQTSFINFTGTEPIANTRALKVQDDGTIHIGASTPVHIKVDIVGEYPW